MKIKVSKLEGVALDWAVFHAENKDRDRGDLFDYPHLSQLVDGLFKRYSPSSNWSQGGPIIEREEIAVYPPDEDDACWIAIKRLADIGGQTPLEAAMRCYVASKFGEEIDVPDELFSI